jgi:hypothetical protein
MVHFWSIEASCRDAARIRSLIIALLKTGIKSRSILRATLWNYETVGERLVGAEATYWISDLEGFTRKMYSRIEAPATK